MIPYSFFVNGADFSDYVHKDGYATDMIPEVAWEAKSLDGTRRRVISKWKHTLTVTMNPMPKKDAERLCKALQKTPLVVMFASLQTGEGVEATMSIESMPQQHQLVAGNYWRRSTTLHFEEL